MPNAKSCLLVVSACLALIPNVHAQQSATASRPTLTALDTCSNNGYDYADLYTPDGIFYWGINSRKSVGREELAEAAGGGKLGCKRAKSATLENPIQGHITVNAVIEPAPEGAIGKSYLVYPGERGIIAPDPEHRGHVGGYQDVYVKTDKGWRIKKRIHIFPPNVPGTYVFPKD